MDGTYAIDSAVWWALAIGTLSGVALLGFRFASAGRAPGKMSKANEQELVDEAKRLLVASGNAERDVARAMQALAALVSAVRLKDGEHAASALLERGRAMFQEREGTDFERDEALEAFENQESLLKERGAEGILEAAFVDGSSVLCRKCAGLVARSRWNAHKTQWCPALANQLDQADGSAGDDDSDGMDVED
jgi:hypothetical protein